MLKIGDRIPLELGGAAKITAYLSIAELLSSRGPFAYLERPCGIPRAILTLLGTYPEKLMSQRITNRLCINFSQASEKAG